MKKRTGRRRTLAQRADKYDLYQRSVQEPDADVRFVQRVYRGHHGRPARRLREDFCGTAAICCAWAAAHPENRALGVDLDPEPLAWGREHNLSKLRPEQARRVRLREGDVLDVRDGRADVVIAFNFSYYLFREREVLARYFRRARSHLAPGGLFILDAYGGPEAQQVQTEPRKCDGFQYVWDQHEFDPISHETLCHIHYRFSDRSRLERAFSYRWRLWTLPEVRELLAGAGFRKVDVYWEDADSRTNEPNGVFRRRRVAPPDPAWVAYLVAER